ncbi:hypothetical protein [Hydrogenibacillus sp. N12]|uniref:hypothetical protein n=1 Tax=Hydrogenibacillus sp. N12 TaxID=2866627 RepID=UPI00339D41FC
MLQEHPESGDRRSEAELKRRGTVVHGKRVRRLLHTFELSLKRKVRKPKPNPLLEPLVLAKERANLTAGLLSEREPDAFEGLHRFHPARLWRREGLVFADSGPSHAVGTWIRLFSLSG